MRPASTPPVRPRPSLRSFGPIGWTRWDDTTDTLIVFDGPGLVGPIETRWRRVVFGLFVRDC